MDDLTNEKQLRLRDLLDRFYRNREDAGLTLGEWIGRHQHDVTSKRQIVHRPARRLHFGFDEAPCTVYVVQLGPVEYAVPKWVYDSFDVPVIA